MAKGGALQLGNMGCISILKMFSVILPAVESFGGVKLC